ncbi:heat shock 70 kDa protein 18-like [Rutidosis leptorrhynchoides]|uniref:heat shock 70 kDa protein 18-like n=1 Tax=Rutidosis leptorrhynchoides TaxID=125765 RepID=UPI003A99B3F4
MSVIPLNVAYTLHEFLAMQDNLNHSNVYDDLEEGEIPHNLTREELDELVPQEQEEGTSVDAPAAKSSAESPNSEDDSFEIVGVNESHNDFDEVIIEDEPIEDYLKYDGVNSDDLPSFAEYFKMNEQLLNRKCEEKERIEVVRLRMLYRNHVEIPDILARKIRRSFMSKDFKGRRKQAKGEKLLDVKRDDTMVTRNDPSTITFHYLSRYMYPLMERSEKGNVLAIGIDLGTTYSCVGTWKDDRIEIIPNEQGNRTTSSCVAFTDSQRFVGDDAKNQSLINSANTIFDAKRLIGRSFSDPQVQEDLKLWPFKVTGGLGDTPMIVVSYKGQKKEFLAEEISSMILAKMRESAEAYLGSDVKNAVVTVPAYFNDSQRQATKDAATIAGLNIVRMINEPTAAVIAYGLNNKSSILGKINVVVFDLGGGTFDVSVMTVEKGDIFEVKGVAGDTHLGGEDFDNRMVEHCVSEFKRKSKMDLTGNERALGRLRFTCEKEKRILSSTTQTSIDLECLHEGIDFSMKFTRAKFEELNNGFFKKCIKTVENCLNDANMKKSCVDEIILVGGSTRIPKVQQMLQDFFDGKQLCKTVNPDEAVACGAAVMAAKLSGGTGKNKSVQNVVLSDVTPLSLGLDTVGEKFYIVIPRNTPIPASNAQYLTTIVDNQILLCIKIYQGERSKSTDNHFLGEFLIDGLPPAPKGVSNVKVYFEIDANGILTVTAGIVATGKTKKITINNERRRLSNDEIEKMIREAEEYKFEDIQFKKKADAHNELENYLYHMRNKIEENNVKNKVYAEMLKDMENAIVDTTKWLKNNHDAPLSELELKKLHLDYMMTYAFSFMDFNCILTDYLWTRWSQ